MKIYKVLLVEDDHAARKSLARFIKREGYEVIDADNGKQGHKLFQEQLPDIVVTDLDMPVMDGMELVNLIKQSSPETPIIVISGQSGLDTIINALRKGIHDAAAGLWSVPGERTGTPQRLEGLGGRGRPVPVRPA